ncbi:MAG: hypothetical protein N2447_08370 [Thermoanaerobaculum sp.]|nr:hypothetical protein [Thermoanaerobaculum sp.]
MTRCLTASAVVVLAAGLLLAPSFPSGAQAPQRPQPVFVVNQPETVQVHGEVRLAGPIEGEVSIRGPIPQGRAVVLGELEVPPVQKGEVARLVRAGSVSTEGFVNMVVSLVGMQRATPTRSGEVGVILLPAEELPLRAWEEHGQLLLAAEAHALSQPGPVPYFAAQPLRATVAFPRYRVFLYNSSDRTVVVTVYVYLTG